MSGDPNCGVCDGAGWDWRRAADEQTQAADPVDYYKCPCVEVERLRAANSEMADALRMVIHDRPSAHTGDVWLAVNKALITHEEARRAR